MDWATNDYTRTYADTIYVPEPDASEGIYLLDEAERGFDPWDRDRPSERRNCGIGRFDPPYRAPSRELRGGTQRSEGGGRRETFQEGYYTGGNIISTPRDNLHRIYGAAWDERPQRYNPRSGPDWARLVPDPRDRPYGGGPTPSPAYPIIPHSAAIDNIWDNSAPTAPSRECGRDPSPPLEHFGGGAPSGRGVAPVTNCGADHALQLVKVFLLIIIVVLLAMTLMAAGRLARALEKAVSEAVGLLGTAAAP